MAVNPWDPAGDQAGDGAGTARLQAISSPASARNPVETAIEDTVAAAFAVGAVAAAIGRYAVELGVEGSRVARRRLLDAPRSAAGHLLGAVADRVVPRAAREVLSRVDVPRLLRDFVDLDAIVELVDLDRAVLRVDLDRAVDRVDIARVLARVDLDAVVAQVDLDRAVDRVDIGRVLDRVDLDAVVARVDLDRAVDRVNIARVLDRVDLDAVVARVDLDRAVDRVDIDRVIDRADIVALAQYVIREIDLPSLVRYSTGSVTTEMVRGVRGQGVDADRAVERVVDRLLMRRHGRRAALPPVESEPRPTPDGEPGS